MPKRENDPAPEDFKVEVDSFLAGFVDLRELIDELVIHILLHRVRKEAGPRGPESIVERLEPVSEEDLPWETVLKREEDFSKNEHNVLVEVIADNPADSTIAPSAMDQKESMKVKELAEGVVSGTHGLRAFFTSHTDSNMGFHDHRHIIGSVTDRKRDPFAVFLGKTDYVRLLLRWDTTTNYRGGKQAQPEEFPAQSFWWEDKAQSWPIDDDRETLAIS